MKQVRNKEVIDMCHELKTKCLCFDLNPDNVWDKVDSDTQRMIASTQWHEVKFIDDLSGELHSDMTNLPNDVGGIYAFVLKPEIIPKTHMYIMYVGRARRTVTQSLKKRCKEYFTDERPKVLMMKEHWGKYLYIRYLPLNDNNIIDKLEVSLINAILPPCNDSIPDKVIMMAKKAAF